MKNITDCIPDIGKKLAVYEKNSLIERLGEDAVKATIAGILEGQNIRNLTEVLTKRRISLSNASLLMTYIEAYQKIPNFSQSFTNILYNNFSIKNNKNEKAYLNWFAGLTEKQIQNVLRGLDKNELKKYLSGLSDHFETMNKKVTDIFGNLKGEIKIGKKQMIFSWLELLQIFTGIGSQTLAIRGSEKSAYGKTFEKLVLSTVLTVLGFRFVHRSNVDKVNNIFWLSERGEKRESDATALIQKGKGIRFDIGFIGVGNTEVSLDKVSRFERNMEFNNYKHDMTTIIIVDRIGEDSRIVDMAKNINGKIVQMSMSNWVKEISEIIYDEYKFKTDIFGLSDLEIHTHIKNCLKNIDLKQILRTKTENI